MTESTLKSSNIFLTIVATILVVLNFVFNFTFLVILLKTRRFTKIDRSNWLITHLIFADFVCAFFILVPSGYGVYNDNFIPFRACHVQTYFYNLFLGLNFHGLLALSIERFIRYQNPVLHINTFTRRLKYDENDKLVKVGSNRSTWIVATIIFFIWLISIFVAFVPLFGDIDQIQYFVTQSQCGYLYERFIWWLWLFFWFSMTVPFLLSIVFFTLTFRLIYLAEHKIKMRKAQFELDTTGKRSGLSINEADHIIQGLDITQQPFNKIYYEHIIDTEVPDDQVTIENDFHVRNQLLTQYKYDTEKGQVKTYFVCLLLTYILVFPVFVIHFYRSYFFTADPDKAGLVVRSTYTGFAWIAYLTLLVKSVVCLVFNDFFRDNLFQSMNRRGFKGLYDFEKRLKELMHKLDGEGYNAARTSASTNSNNNRVKREIVNNNNNNNEDLEENNENNE
jgi:hypothetical protein